MKISVEAKKCNKCGETKKIELFYRDRKKATGRKNICIECDKAQLKKRLEKRPVEPEEYPEFICQNCGKKFKLDFNPSKDYNKFRTMICPHCNKEAHKLH